MCNRRQCTSLRHSMLYREIWRRRGVSAIRYHIQPDHIQYAYDRKLPHSPPPAWGVFLKEKGRCTIPCWILFPKPLAPGATVVRGDVFQRCFTFLAFMIWAWFHSRSFRNLTLAYLSGQISQHFAACSTSRFSVSFAWNIPLPETKKKRTPSQGLRHQIIPIVQFSAPKLTSLWENLPGSWFYLYYKWGSLHTHWPERSWAMRR